MTKSGRTIGRASESRRPRESLAAFVLGKDDGFRNEARAAIFCYDEAGLGTRINSIRLLQDGKPLLGFLHRDANRRSVYAVWMPYFF